MSVRAVPVLIVGGGPAGMAASVELVRQGHKPIILERSRLGGLLCNANLVENYPGFPEGIGGVVLVEKFKEQVKRHELEVIYEEVISLEHKDGIFRVLTQKRELRSQAVIIATGTKPLTIDGLADEAAANGRIHHEIYPIREATGKRIAIIGAGDVAFDYALSLAKHNEVVILNRNSDPKSCPGLRRMVQEAASITCQPNTNVIFPVRPHQHGVSLKCQNATGETEIYADYVVVAIGRTADTACLLKELIESRVHLESEGLLQFAGDVLNADFRQTGIAVGGGILAAMRVARTLEGIS